MHKIQMRMDYAYNTNQEIIIIQLGLGQAFDHLHSFFLAQLIQKMGSVRPSESSFVWLIKMGFSDPLKFISVNHRSFTSVS